jgi:hypothetical protein
VTVDIENDVPRKSKVIFPLFGFCFCTDPEEGGNLVPHGTAPFARVARVEVKNVEEVRSSRSNDSCGLGSKLQFSVRPMILADTADHTTIKNKTTAFLRRCRDAEAAMVSGLRLVLTLEGAAARRPGYPAKKLAILPSDLP